MHLTDARIRTLKPNGATDRRLADGNGRYIRARRSRDGITRTWIYRRKVKNRRIVVTLGTYPAMSLRKARLKAAELAAKRDLDSPTVSEATDPWLSERVNKTLRKADQVRGYVERAIIPALGTRRVRDVGPAEIARVVRDYRDRVGKLARGRMGYSQRRRLSEVGRPFRGTDEVE